MKLQACPQCGGKLIRAPYVVICAEPACDWLPPRGERHMPFATFHRFIDESGSSNSYGSCEIFKLSFPEAKELDLEPGWYWWARQPGCLPDTEGGPNGPFNSRKEAMEDADCTADVGR